MRNHQGIATFLLFFLLLIIILLQILSMIQSDRLYQRINHLGQIVERTAANAREEYPEETSVTDGVDHADQDGWLVWAFRVEPKTLNPISAEAGIYTTWIAIPYIFEPLLTHDYDQEKLKPCLAQRYEISDDRLKITFRLRDDICFSDGVPVTADDVIFTYKTIINPDVDAANIASQFTDITAVRRVDDLAVEFSLKRACSKSLDGLPWVWTTGILPKHVYQFHDAQEFNRRVSDPIGSGPYVFHRWDVGKEIILRRNENYWGNKPRLERMVYRFISNPAACIQALRCHEVDIVIPEPEQFADLVNDKQFKREFYCLSYWTPWTPFYYIGWNQETAFFADRQVRLAMIHLVNRKQIIKYLLGGYGMEISGPFYVFGPQNDQAIEPWPYDLDKARELLDQAGWRDTDGDGLRDKDGVAFRFRFMYSNSYALYNRLARLLKDEAAKVGIEVIAEPCEWAILSARLNSRKFDAYIAGLGFNTPKDPYGLFHSSQTNETGLNYVHFCNARADAIIEQAGRTVDDEQRDELYRQLHRILHDEQPYTFLFTRPTLRFVDRRFENVKVHKMGLNYLQWYVPRAKQKYK